jgi:pentatricopeptide repeat protein
MWELAVKTREDMELLGVTPNIMTWTALIGACANVGMVDHAFSLFNEMSIAGCAPNT